LVELPFAGANFLKIHHGGWFPLLLALGIFLVMSTWKRGRQILWNRIRSMTLPHSAFMEAVAGPNFCRAGTNAVYRHADGQAGKEEPFTWIGGTAIFMVGNPDGTPLALTHNLEHNKVLHERIIFLTVMPADAPRVSDDQRVSVEAIQATEDAKGFYRVKARVGFMEQPDVLKVLRLCEPLGLSFDLAHTTFFLSRETILPSDHPGMAIWRERLFSLLSRNAQSATAFFRLPATRVVELGMQVEI
jgi:KUP system potassium uptake protein